MAVINTNVKALFSQMALGSSGRAQSVAMQQLSTGKRINSARDDAAGMAIATRMTHQIRSLNQAVRNAGDAINLIQTAEGATNEITDMMIRMRELAIQSVNDTNANEQRSYLDLEFQQLKQEIVRIADTTEWNGFPVLNGTAGERVGEMPVFKTTSLSQFGTDLINTNTDKTLSGSEVGAQQVLEFDFGTVTDLQGQSIVVGGVTVNFANDLATEADAMTTIKTAMEANAAYDPAKNGRKLSIPDGTQKLVIQYPASEGDVRGDDLLDDEVTIDAKDTAVAAPSTFTYRALTQTKEAFPNGGGFSKVGALQVDLTTDADGAPVITANFFPMDGGKKVLLTIDSSKTDLANGRIYFTSTDGMNSDVISGDLSYEFKNQDGTNIDLETNPREVSLQTKVSGSIPTLKTGDLQINGIDIDASMASDDKLSPPNNAAGSAIAKAAAINRKAADYGFSQGESQSITFTGVIGQAGSVSVGGVSVYIDPTIERTPAMVTAKVAAALKNSTDFGADSGRSVTYAPGSTVINVDFAVKDGDTAKLEVNTGTTGLTRLVDTTRPFMTAVPGTGVYAKVNENVMTGQSMDASSVATGVIFINGFASANITTALNNPRETRVNVMRAINLMTDKTGVKAIDTGFDTQGITLVAKDGRNIEVSFDTPFDAGLFGHRIGMKEGVQSSTISLESKVDAPVVLTSKTGNIENAGFVDGNFSKNQSTLNTNERAPVLTATAQTELIKFGEPVEDATTGDFSTFSITVRGQLFQSATTCETSEQARQDLMTQINQSSVPLGVKAVAGDKNNELLIVADEPGTPFKMSTTSSDETTSIQQKQIVANSSAQVVPLKEGDLEINGIKIPAARAEDDTLSDTTATSSNRAASAIAIAAAINSQSPLTGVRAYPNEVVSEGVLTDTATPAKTGDYTLYINGTAITVKMELGEDAQKRLEKVRDAINIWAGNDGVSAEINPFNSGLTLKSDGRNMSVWFDGSVEGLSAASFGLDKGGAVAQESTIKITDGTNARAAADVVKVSINGVEITADTASTDDATDTYNALYDAISAAIAADKDLPVGQQKLQNLEFVLDPDATSPTSLTIKSTVPGTPFTLSGAKTELADGSIDLALSTKTENSVGKNDVTAILNATATSPEAKTLYGTVRMVSDPALLPMGMPSPIGAPPSDQLAMLKATGKPFTVSAGINGFSAVGSFEALGFQAGTFGGRSSEDLDPPRVGRLAFQVGAGAKQLITIDLADFGKGGPITGAITGDVDLNVEQRSTRINTREGASSVLALLDASMEKVNATRATMGAIMNRLDHVISNLTNVSMNLSASRSAIEDADYASASTELAKTQIMQQAATAVLAQANTSQQTVLKLLGG